MRFTNKTCPAPPGPSAPAATPARHSDIQKIHNISKATTACPTFLWPYRTVLGGGGTTQLGGKLPNRHSPIPVRNKTGKVVYTCFTYILYASAILHLHLRLAKGLCCKVINQRKRIESESRSFTIVSNNLPFKVFTGGRCSGIIYGQLRTVLRRGLRRSTSWHIDSI